MTEHDIVNVNVGAELPIVSEDLRNDRYNGTVIATRGTDTYYNALQDVKSMGVEYYIELLRASC
jgi:hypothetical protein